VRNIILLILLSASLLLCGCTAKEIGWADYAGDVATATANGAATGGPVGAVIGLLTGIGAAFFSNRRKVKKIENRQAVIERYRELFGNLEPEEIQCIKQKKPLPARKRKNDGKDS